MSLEQPSRFQLFVRLPGTGKFLKASGRWTRRIEAAFRFPNLLNAINACLAFGLEEIELVVRYAENCPEICYRLNRELIASPSPVGMSDDGR